MTINTQMYVSVVIVTHIHPPLSKVSTITITRLHPLYHIPPDNHIPLTQLHYDNHMPPSTITHLHHCHINITCPHRLPHLSIMTIKCLHPQSPIPTPSHMSASISHLDIAVTYLHHDHMLPSTIICRHPQPHVFVTIASQPHVAIDNHTPLSTITYLHHYHTNVTAIYCNTLQHTATSIQSHISITITSISLQHTATHCNTLQHQYNHRCSSLPPPYHCNTLQHIATH